MVSPRVVDGGAGRGNHHCSMTGLTDWGDKTTHYGKSTDLINKLLMHYVNYIFLPFLSVLPKTYIKTVISVKYKVLRHII